MKNIKDIYEVDENDLVKFSVWTLKMFLKTVKPWKRKNFDPDNDHGMSYNMGWNDCVKEMKKQGDRYIKMVEKINS